MTARPIPTDADWAAGLVAIGHTPAEAAALLAADPKPSNDGDAGHWAEDRRDDRTGGTHWRDDAEDRAARRRA